MNQQVQQKTMQLQGIETLLAEASTLANLETDAGMVAAPTSSDTQTTPEPTTEPAAAVALTQAEPSGADDASAIAEASEAVPAQAAVPLDAAQSKQTASEPSTKAKSQQSSSAKAATNKAATKKKSSVKSQSRPKASKAQAQPKSRALLRSEFADVSLTEAVTQVLTQAADPLHLDQLVSEMYEDISGEDLRRVKGALANVLSKGKKSGKWQNVGNGMYQIKA